VTASLRIGPLLRYVGEREAVVWVETDAPCTVEVLGVRERTFHVEGHHYALVAIADLEPSTWHEYEVALDGERVWPEPDSPFPPSRFRTLPKAEPARIVFGSCRVAAPNAPPYSLTKDEDERGREIDALHTLALQLADEPREALPELLLLLGDQVYADEVSPHARSVVETRRSPDDPPGDRVVDFEEYTELYRESWTEPAIRWLLSTVSTAMIFDDHDVHDDWNISQRWVDEMRTKTWWNEHIVAALMSYWIYQHLGNIPPQEHPDDELLARVKAADDAGPILREFAYRADRESAGARWSYCRDVGGTRVVVVDSRAGRVLDENRRSMVDDEEWDWIAEHATGGHDHLLIATSLPWVLGGGLQYLEAWSEAVAGGAWGGLAATLAEKLRRTFDLEHWGAFQRSFEKLAELQRSVGAGERGAAPASILTLSGDVHHAYLFEIAFRRGAGVRSAAYQAVCSPYRNPLDAKERRVIRAGMSSLARDVTRALARAAGVADPSVRWRNVGDGPWFDNQVATLTVDGRRIAMRLDKAVPVDETKARLERVLDRRLA
jgi:PhoD-like phosphatase